MSLSSLMLYENSWKCNPLSNEGWACGELPVVLVNLYLHARNIEYMIAHKVLQNGMQTGKD